MKAIRRLRAWHLAIICFISALFILFHQFLISGGIWFEWGEFLHHESFIVVIIILGIGLLIGNKLRQ